MKTKELIELIEEATRLISCAGLHHKVEDTWLAKANQAIKEYQESEKSEPVKEQTPEVWFPAQCACGHLFLEKYILQEPNEKGEVGFCWCGFCKTKLMVKSLGNQTYTGNPPEEIPTAKLLAFLEEPEKEQEKCPACKTCSIKMINCEDHCGIFEAWELGTQLAVKSEAQQPNPIAELLPILD